MGQEAVQNILEGLRMGQARQTEAFRQKLETTRAEQEKAYRDAVIQNAKDQQAEQKRQFDVTSKAAKAIQDLQHMKEIGLMSDFLSKGGNLPGQSSPMGTSSSSGANFSPASGQSDTMMQTLPVNDEQGQPVQIPYTNPQVKAQQDAALTTIRNKPIEDAKIRETEASKQADYMRYFMTKQQDDARAKAQQDAENLRNDARIAAENWRTKYTVDSKNNSIDDNFDASPYIQGGMDGTVTQEEINKLPTSKINKMKTIGAVTKAGGRIINDKEKATFQDFGTISSVIPRLDRALQLLKDHPVEVRTPFTDAYKEYNQLIGHMELVLPQIARVVAGDKGRLSNLQMQLVNGGFIPSRNPASSDINSNTERRNIFVNLMNEMFKSKAGKNPGQAELFKKTYGIRDMDPAPGGMQNATPATRPSLDSYYSKQ